MGKIYPHRENCSCFRCKKVIHLSEEHKRKIGIANSMRLKGKKMPEHVKSILRKANIGRKLSYEAKKKISDSKIGDKHWNWKNGINKHSGGYIYILKKDHPFCNSNGYVFEHRLVMEKHIGRYLFKDEFIHHINHIKTDNRIENLIIFKGHSEHRKHHLRESGIIK